jgi:MarR family transcriptional regulator, organic hydroperoxide resistance regulator
MKVAPDQDVRLVELVIALFDEFREHANTCMAGFDLSTAHAAALLRLDTPLSQRELADCLKYDASNITGIVDTLEDRGLVERRVDPTDRRVRRLVVTVEGSRVLTHLRTCFEEASLVERLDDDERTQLRVLLAKAVGDRTPTSWAEMLRNRR